MLFRKIGTVFLTVLVLVLSACQSPVNVAQNTAALTRDVTLSGSAGSVAITNMSNTSLTVTYSPGVQYTSVQLYLSQGNSTGLVLASQNMNYSAGTYSYTYSNASYTAGALIYVAVVQNNNGVETTVPGGSISNVSSWMSFTYAASSPSPSPTPTTSPSPTPAPSGLTVTGANGSLVLSAMSSGNVTVAYTPTSAITSAALYLSQGNGTGLVIANQAMTNSSGTWTATVNNATFTAGALIYVDVVATTNGVQTNVPQGSVSNVSSWASFTYAATPTPTPTPTTSPSPSPSPSSSPSPTPSGNTVTGTNGTVEISNMANGNVTVTYTPATAITSAALYLSQGNGTGLVVANQAMTNSSGSWSATANNSTFTAGAVIYVDVVATTNGVQTSVPQGSVSNVTSWSSFTYAAAPSPTPTPAPTTSPSPSPTNSPVPGGTLVAGTNGSVVVSGMTNNQVTVSYTPTSSITSANLYLTLGNGTGLALASQPMTNSGGTWSYTFSAPSYIWGVKIGVDVLASTNGVVVDVPEGVVNDATTWATFAYGSQATYTITFDGQGATTPASVASATVGGPNWTLTNFPVAPAKTGYTFGGWFTSPNGAGTPFYASTVVTANMTVYADWVSGSPAPVTNPTNPVPLIPLTGSSLMTIQFQNNTNGAWPDSSIYLLVIARNSAHAFCYLTPDGNLVPLTAGQNLQGLFYRMSDISGFQVPAFMDSARLYVALGQPLNIPVNTDINGNVGVAFPNIENPTDPSINDDFDWIEFAVVNNNIWANTTQVDQFDIPMVVQLYTGTSTSYSLLDTVGVTETRSQIFNEFEASVPPEFAGLVQAHRIVAPLHGGFRTGQPNAGYFDNYINQVWQEYTTQPFVVTVPQGTFTGYVQGNEMAFTRPNDSTIYYVQKPTSDDVWGGMGTLNSGNTIELVLEAQICAAFHRHVMDNASALNTPSAYYQTAPFDYYAQFWHEHSINQKAYGFCYDDVNSQSSTMTTPNPRGLVVSVGW